ncbi:metalloprotease TIKI homolog [Halichondria panicea]|uniref:metalloprotease TIKI homolog n=1 Tax=Halichondria panicea TaxID=6063 RepID=UPI00312B31F0
MSVHQVLYIIPFLLSLLTLISSSDDCSEQNSYLWKVDTQPPLYLFGTMHVPYTKLWDFIPENVKTAFSSCDEVCLELRLSDDETRQELYNCQLLSGGVESVEEVLSKDMVQRIEQYLESIRKLFSKWLPQSGSPLLGGVDSDTMFKTMTNGWKNKRPVWILMLISSLTEENIINRNIPLLDLFMDNVAEKLGKEVQAMESPRDQCRPLNKISDEKVELALRVQLDYLEGQLAISPDKDQESNIYTYRCGDFKKLVLSTSFLPLPPLDNITVTSPTLTPNETAVLHSVEDYLWNQMVLRRNRRMANSIHSLLSNTRNKTYFVALGAGHYLSNSNVIQRLRRKGHTVEHIPVQKEIDGPTLPSNTVQLGDPNKRVIDLDATQGEETPRRDYPTLSPEANDRIWNYIKSKPPVAPPSEQQGDHRTARQSPLLTDATQEQGTPDSSNTHGDMWSQEVMDLFQYQEQSVSGSNSILVSTKLNTILLLALVAALSLSALW